MNYLFRFFSLFRAYSNESVRCDWRKNHVVIKPFFWVVFGIGAAATVGKGQLSKLSCAIETFERLWLAAWHAK